MMSPIGYTITSEEQDFVLTSDPCDPRTCQDCRDANPLTGPDMVVG